MKVPMLTRGEVVSHLRAIMGDNGRDRVARAVYRVGKRPECIVGHFALRLGGKDALMALREGTSVTHNLFVLEPLGVDYEENLEPLRVFQFRQDRGDSWGECLDRVEELYPDSKELYPDSDLT